MDKPIDDIFKPWLLDKPRTEEEMKVLREHTMEELEKIGHGIERFTCDDCEDRFICTLVYDPYNTDGDCLLMK